MPELNTWQAERPAVALTERITQSHGDEAVQQSHIFINWKECDEDKKQANGLMTGNYDITTEMLGFNGQGAQQEWNIWLNKNFRIS